MRWGSELAVITIVGGCCAPERVVPPEASCSDRQSRPAAVVDRSVARAGDTEAPPLRVGPCILGLGEGDGGMSVVGVEDFVDSLEDGLGAVRFWGAAAAVAGEAKDGGHAAAAAAAEGKIYVRYMILWSISRIEGGKDNERKKEVY